jgi:hypothetical protein
VEKSVERLLDYGSQPENITADRLRVMISDITRLFVRLMLQAGFERRQITRITTKFRDAGRRSPPWQPASKKVPGRPQDGADGNRRLRWLFGAEHKFYADEVTATLVEIKYYLQALSFDNAPPLPNGSLETVFSWLIEHPVRPGEYLDPIQLEHIDARAVISDARLIQSGHLIPLDRGGKHEPRNAFLMLARSNQLQGNLTLDELLALMETILARHRQRRS